MDDVHAVLNLFILLLAQRSHYKELVTLQQLRHLPFEHLVTLDEILLNDSRV